MTPDEARQVEEAIAKAKDSLLDALRIAERSSNAKFACQIGALCGRTETLQRTAREQRAKSEKPLTLRQFAKAHGL